MTAPRRIMFGVGLTCAAAAAIVIGWSMRTPSVVPPMPDEIQDAEVRQVIESTRAQVLRDSSSAPTWGKLGKVLLAHLFDREADFCFARAAQLDPQEPLWPYARGLIAVKRAPDRALEWLRQATSVDGELDSDARAALRWQLAETLLERGVTAEAEILFRDFDSADRIPPRPALGLALIAMSRGEHSEATRFLAIAVTSPYARKKATVQLAALARLRGDREAAEAREMELAKLPDDPPWPDPLLDEIITLQVGRRGRERRASQLEHQRRFAEAAEIYLEQIAVEPAAQACIGAGVNLARLRDYERAVPLLLDAVRLEPDSANAHYSLGLVLFARAERAAATTPQEPRLKEWFQQAADHSRRATELRTDHARAYLFWGLSLQHLGDAAAAVAPLRKGVACQPSDFELQWALGEALRQTKHWDEARTHLHNASRLAPDDPRPAQALKLLADIKK